MTFEKITKLHLQSVGDSNATWMHANNIITTALHMRTEHDL